MIRKILVLAVVVAVAVPEMGDTTARTLLSRALANSLYCQLAGCTMVGTLNVPTEVVGTGTQRYLTDAYGTGPQVHVSATNLDSGGYLTSATAGNIFVTGGVAYNGSTFTAKNTSAAILSVGATTIIGSVDNSLTAGNTYAPTNKFVVDANIFDVKTLLQPTGSIFRVTGDFTLAANTSLQLITGLTWALPANTAANYPFHCELLYSQATAVVADQFGIQAVTFAPTNIMAKADVATSASATTYGNFATLASTTATAIVTFTPSAITTVWNARIAGFIENPSNASAQTINIMAQTSNSADLVTVKRGSYCVVGF